jgi:hypothetical protein
VPWTGGTSDVHRGVLVALDGSSVSIVGARKIALSGCTADFVLDLSE